MDPEGPRWSKIQLPILGPEPAAYHTKVGHLLDENAARMVNDG